MPVVVKANVVIVQINYGREAQGTQKAKNKRPF